MKTYKSKIGIELSVPIFGLLAIMGTFMAVKGIWVGLGIIALVTALIVHLFMTTYYQISRNEIRIKSGFFYDKTIHISSIKKIIQTRNPLSSPALSLDRIELRYNRFDSVMISPEDKEGFVLEVLAVCGGIEVVGCVVGREGSLTIS
ncbi:PH domain-containing protein [Dyadobacter sp. CY347]|uniref:PH domain-containing protein n=1 Tax=Dyadobacter sp. CY347 TaxID=2909336 RepID=UPI001F1D52B8|nr:PH domain-containing protein [Dyadobacter sp. CY347]MCF2487529.1 PH domain-containing protein [Dyadobacter sp. CY347]